MLGPPGEMRSYFVTAAIRYGEEGEAIGFALLH
jgi:hypothetical protein